MSRDLEKVGGNAREWEKMVEDQNLLEGGKELAMRPHPARDQETDIAYPNVMHFRNPNVFLIFIHIVRKAFVRITYRKYSHYVVIWSRSIVPDLSRIPHRIRCSNVHVSLKEN